MAKSSIRFEVTEDVSKGLDALQQRVSEEMEDILNEMAYDATGREGEEDAPIPHRMSTSFNPFLYTSGQELTNRFVEISERKSTIDIIYSGMDLDLTLGDDARRWWEFSEDFDPTLALERDYAYFQETGRDPVVKDPRQARHKYAIEFGMKDAARPMIHTLKYNVRRILNML